jgi:hypothetical protein
MTRAIVIPCDGTQPLRWVDHPEGDYKNMTALVFDGDRDGGTYSLSVVGNEDRQVSMWYDDNGLFRLDQGEKLSDIINLRAMELWSSLTGGMDIFQFVVPLVGTYVITGQADEEGNSLDAPAWVIGFPFTWHDKYLVVENDEDAEQENP